MPAGGSRERAGRKRGGRNKATEAKLAQRREAEEIASEIGNTDPVALAAALARAKERRFRGLDEMIEIAKVLKNYVIEFQAAAVNVGRPGAKTFNPRLWEMFKDWGKFYFDACGEIASFQDPKLKAVTAMPVPGVGATAGDAAKVVDGKVVRMGSAAAAGRAYQRLMQAPRETPALPPPSKKRA